MANDITPDGLWELGFVKSPHWILENSFTYLLCENSICKKELTMSIRNDKGQGEYYVFLRQTTFAHTCEWTDIHHPEEVEVASLGRNGQSLAVLKQLIEILTILNL